MNKSIYDLLNAENVKTLTKAFAFATGMGVVLTDPNGRHIGPENNFCEFCQLMNREAAQQCYRSNMYALKISIQTRKPFVFICHAGLIDMITPLFLNNRLIGSLMAGQIQVDSPVDLPRSGSHGMRQLSQILRSDAVTESTRLRINACAQMLPIVATLITNTLSDEVKGITPATSEAHRPSSAALAVYSDKSGHAWLQHNYLISRLLSLGEIDHAKSYVDQSIDLTRYLCVSQTNMINIRVCCKYLQNFLSMQERANTCEFSLETRIADDASDLFLPTYFLIDLISDSFAYQNTSFTPCGKLYVQTSRKERNIVLVVRDDNTGFLPPLVELETKTYTKADDILKEDFPASFKKALYDLFTTSKELINVEFRTDKNQTKLSAQFKPR
jgi:two-component system LytT family sensor kinase